MSFIIEGNNLAKKYEKKRVLENVNFHVKKGEIYGLVGPNGAGKSTLLKIILDLIKADSGSITVFGKNNGISNMDLRRTGSIIENPYFYEYLSAYKNLWLHSQYMGCNDEKRLREVLEIVSLSDSYEKKVSHYSLGMKQRLAIARAILSNPELLILDEPINALDPEGIREMRQLFIRLNRENGTTILISSHILSEMEMIADHIGILNQGRMIREISLEDIYKENQNRILVEVDNLEKAVNCIRTFGINEIVVKNEHQLEILNKNIETHMVSELIVNSGIKLHGIYHIKRTLEEYFFQNLTNNDVEGK